MKKIALLMPLLFIVVGLYLFLTQSQKPITRPSDRTEPLPLLTEAELAKQKNLDERVIASLHCTRLFLMLTDYNSLRVKMLSRKKGTNQVCVQFLT